MRHLLDTARADSIDDGSLRELYSDVLDQERQRRRERYWLELYQAGDLIRALVCRTQGHKKQYALAIAAAVNDVQVLQWLLTEYSDWVDFHVARALRAAIRSRNFSAFSYLLGSRPWSNISLFASLECALQKSLSDYSCRILQAIPVWEPVMIWHCALTTCSTKPALQRQLIKHGTRTWLIADFADVLSVFAEKGSFQLVMSTLWDNELSWKPEHLAPALLQAAAAARNGTGIYIVKEILRASTEWRKEHLAPAVTVSTSPAVVELLKAMLPADEWKVLPSRRGGGKRRGGRRGGGRRGGGGRNG